MSSNIVNALVVRDLKVAAGKLPILKGVDLVLAPGDRLGLVGESGSGKSILALSIMQLQRPPVRIVSGDVCVGAVNLTKASRHALDRVRGSSISMIFQDASQALNPLMTVGDQVVEAVMLHSAASKHEAVSRAIDLLGDVGIPNARKRFAAYPYEFSGGMRQRVMIAIALAGDPAVLLCDEPTTALDVTTQAKVLSLLDRLCAARGLAALLITHDMGVAAGFCDEMAVMYAGEIMERATTPALYSSPRHPYTQALMSATLDLDADIARPLPTIEGQPTLAHEVLDGCAFAPRCPFAIAACKLAKVDLEPAGRGLARCIRVDELPSAAHHRLPGSTDARAKEL